jgi:CRP/FNR family cyclic AMP-dependent transcriptional regulator
METVARKVTSIDSKKQVLRRVSFFASLRELDLEALAVRSTWREVAPDEPIFHEGEKGSELYIVMSGEVLIFKGDETEKHVLAVRGPGAILGEMALLDGNPRAASVMAKTSGVLLRLHRDDLLTIMKGKPEIALEIIRVLCQRLRESDVRGMERASQEVGQRLAAYLQTNQQTDTQSGRAFVIRTRDQDIADAIGTRREVVNRILGQWSKEGFVERTKARIYFVKAADITRLANGEKA